MRHAVWFSSLMLLSMGCGGGASRPDAPDAGLSDAGLPDAGVEDAGPGDAGMADAGAGACAAFDLTPYRGASCFCGAECDCYLDLPYGDRATWTEGGRTLTQTIDVYVPKASAGARPLVVWAHPNGSTKNVGGTLGQQLGLPVLRVGYAFASVEFRHPVTNRSIGAPRTDLADAVQHLRCHAATLGLDATRVAGTGRSRGTLLVWTALQDDLADLSSSDPVARQSTRLRGVWAINAQTSYWGEWIAQTFFDSASQAAVLAAFGSTNHGHAVGDVSPDDPPVHVVYDSALAALPLASSDCQQFGGAVDCVHLPNFGDELCKAYGDAGVPAQCTVAYQVPTANLYDAVPFLQSVLTP